MINLSSTDLLDLVLDPAQNDMAKAFGISDGRWTEIGDILAFIMADLEEELNTAEHFNPIVHEMIDRIARSGLVRNVRELTVVIFFIGIRTQKINHTREIVKKIQQLQAGFTGVKPIEKKKAQS